MKFETPEIEEINGIVSVEVTCTAPWPPTEEIEIAAAAALGWTGSVARMLTGSDLDESSPTRTLRFARYYEWTVKVRVSATWVADGFNLDADRAHSMVAHDLGYATSDEIEAEIVSAPPRDDIAREQGYTAADDPRLAQ